MPVRKTCTVDITRARFYEKGKKMQKGDRDVKMLTDIFKEDQEDYEAEVLDLYENIVLGCREKYRKGERVLGFSECTEYLEKIREMCKSSPLINEERERLIVEELDMETCSALAKKSGIEHFEDVHVLPAVPGVEAVLLYEGGSLVKAYTDGEVGKTDITEKVRIIMDDANIKDGEDMEVRGVVTADALERVECEKAVLKALWGETDPKDAPCVHFLCTDYIEDGFSREERLEKAKKRGFQTVESLRVVHSGEINSTLEEIIRKLEESGLLKKHNTDTAEVDLANQAVLVLLKVGNSEKEPEKGKVAEILWKSINGNIRPLVKVESGSGELVDILLKEPKDLIIHGVEKSCTVRYGEGPDGLDLV